MGDFSVKAILSATDKNFSSTMKSALGYTNNLKSTLTCGIGFGAMMAIGQKAISVVANSTAGLVNEIDSSNAAWKTFSSNMQMVGKNTDEIAGIKKELQAFAEQTIYSSSDMASTFSQLEAVGTKNTTKLVKGFGGLAAAAENPQQAMKTLSQQATQMAAKPTVAWMDFKLMLEQTPAGIAAVAKQMGKTTSQLVTDVQDGKVSTEEFFDAISAVGTNDAFTKLATTYKTAGQAMDGLQETVANKLTPSFDVLSGVAISCISGIIDKMGEMDGDALATKVSGFVDNASKYWSVFKADFIEAKNAFGDAVSAIVSDIGELTGAFGSTESVNSFSDMLGVATNALTNFAGFCEEHSETIAKVITLLPKLYIAYKGFQIVRTVAPFVGAFTVAIGGLAKMGLSKLAPNLFNVAKGQDEVGKSSGSSSKKMVASAKAFMMLGVGVLTISAGFYLLAQSAVAVANAGPLAVGVLAGLVITVSALSVGMVKMLSSMKGGTKKLSAMSTAMLALGASILLISAGFWILSNAAVNLANAGPLAVGAMLGMSVAIGALLLVAKSVAPTLTAGAVGFMAFGAAITLAGVGMMFMSNAAISLANAGPLAIGVMVGMVAAIAGLAVGAALLGPALTAGAVGFIAFGAAIVLVGAGALLAAAALNVVAGVLPTVVQYGAQGAVSIAALGAGMLVFAVGATMAGAGCMILGAGLLVAAAGLVVFGAGMTVASAGTVVMSLALKTVNSSMKSIASNAKSAKSSLTSMTSSIDVVNSGLDALGNKAKSGINKLTSAFSNGAGKAQSSAQTMMNGFNSGISTGGNMAVATSRSITNSIVSSMRSASSGSYSCGVYIGQGLANGMKSQLGIVRSVAVQLAAAAEEAIRAKAKIHSPSRISDKLGQYWGEGWIGGLISKVKDAWKAAEELVSIPDLAASDANLSFAGSYGNATLSEDYNYNHTGTYTIIVPVEVDGREFARATASYTQEELDKKEMVGKRIRGEK
ncbi:MAG: tape measure protein [Lachnospiraceae bacterium]